MKCPRTGNNLKPLSIGGIIVDVSESCGGIFFDNFELGKFDEKDEVEGAFLVDHLKNFTLTKVDLSERIFCPKCVETKMYRRFHSPKRQIEVDECRTCGGIWLDFGELDHIRTLFPSSADRQLVSDEFYEKFVNSEEYIALATEKVDRQSNMKSFTNIVSRFFHFWS